MDKKIPLVIYHANCTDGFGAAYAAWQQMGDAAVYLPCNYGDLLPLGQDNELSPEYLADRDVYILDFSFPPSVTEHIIENCNRLVWLDHHASAIKAWCGANYLTPERQRYVANTFPLAGSEFGEIRECYINLDNQHSGAVLAWEYFHPGGDIPLLIQHIEDRDLWKWKMTGTRGVGLALRHMYDQAFDVWDDLMEPDNYGSLWSSGQTLQVVQDRHVKKVAEGRLESIRLFRIGEIEPEYGLGANVTTDVSEIGNAIAVRSGTFSLTFFVLGNDAVCSLRSVGDYDVSGLAEYYGGGGHKNASGFKVPLTEFFGSIWVKEDPNNAKG